MDQRIRQVLQIAGGACVALQQVRMEQVLALEAAVQQRQDEEERRRRRLLRNPRLWVRDWIRRRPQQGYYHNLFRELEIEDPKAFKRMMRMEPAMFHELVERLTPRLQKCHTCRGAPLSVGIKVAITLKYLAHGERYICLAHGFRVPDNTISIVVRDVCRAIIEEFKPEVLKCPTTREEWRLVADGFLTRWNVNHGCGALDGKHVRVKKPPKSGSNYFNYKKYFSILMLALVDADYKFLWVDVGAPGSCSDAQLYNNSLLKEMLDDGELNLPPADRLPGDDADTAYFFLGDDAFGLRPTMMKPYAQRHLTRQQRLFNYRLSRGRRVVENAFGILANRFGCLLTTMFQRPQHVQTIVLACVVLHNLMRTRYPGIQNALVDREDDDHNMVEGAWRRGNEFDDVGGPAPARNRDTFLGKQQRDRLAAYWSSPVGAVAWQDRMVATPAI